MSSDTEDIEVGLDSTNVGNTSPPESSNSAAPDQAPGQTVPNDTENTQQTNEDIIETPNSSDQKDSVQQNIPENTEKIPEEIVGVANRDKINEIIEHTDGNTDENIEEKVNETSESESTNNDSEVTANSEELVEPPVRIDSEQEINRKLENDTTKQLSTPNLPKKSALKITSSILTSAIGLSNMPNASSSIDSPSTPGQRRSVTFFQSPAKHFSENTISANLNSNLPEPEKDQTSPDEKNVVNPKTTETAIDLTSSPVIELHEIWDGSCIPKGLSSSSEQEELATAYTDSCKLHGSVPIPVVLEQIKHFPILSTELYLNPQDITNSNTNSNNSSSGNDTSEENFTPHAPPKSRKLSIQSCQYSRRIEKFSLRGQRLTSANVEPLEEIFKRVQFIQVDLENTDFSDFDAAVALMEIIEYYDSVEELDIGYQAMSMNFRTWSSLARIVRRSHSLKCIDVRGSYVPEPALTTWCRGIRGSTNLKILHLENTQLSGRPFSLLCVALHHNRSINELYLSDNELNTTDMKSLSFALKTNRVIGHLDLRNNNLQDSGVRELVYGLNQQLQHYQNSEEVKLKERKEEEEKEKDLLENDAIDKVSIGATSTNTEVETETGVHTLVLWNNKISGNSMQAVAQVIKKYDWLLTLNLGQNPKIGDDGVFNLRPGLQRAKLQRLGMYNCGLECEGAVAIAEVIAEAKELVRIDLRKNDIRFSGIMALSLAMRNNKSLLCLNLESSKFSIKKNYKTNSSQRAVESDSDSDSDDMVKERIKKNNNRVGNNGDTNTASSGSPKKDNDSEEELAEHQAMFLKDIVEYQSRNQDLHKQKKLQETEMKTAKKERLEAVRRKSQEASAAARNGCVEANDEVEVATDAAVDNAL